MKKLNKDIASRTISKIEKSLSECIVTSQLTNQVNFDLLRNKFDLTKNPLPMLGEPNFKLSVIGQDDEQYSVYPYLEMETGIASFLGIDSAVEIRLKDIFNKLSSKGIDTSKIFGKGFLEDN